MQLPLKLPIELMQTRWSAILNFFISNPLNDVSIVTFTLASGSNKIPHLLGRMQKGWFIVDINAAITLYRSQPFNEQFLYLTASGPATISLGVF